MCLQAWSHNIQGNNGIEAGTKKDSHINLARTSLSSATIPQLRSWSEVWQLTTTSSGRGRYLLPLLLQSRHVHWHVHRHLPRYIPFGQLYLSDPVSSTLFEHQTDNVPDILVPHLHISRPYFQVSITITASMEEHVHTGGDVTTTTTTTTVRLPVFSARSYSPG